MLKDEGPTPKPLQYTCNGCKHLKLERWSLVRTNAECMLANKSLGTYYCSEDNTPDWCPFIAESDQKHAGLFLKLSVEQQRQALNYVGVTDFGADELKL